MNAALALAAAVTKPWAGHDTRLIVVTVIGIAIIVALIVVLKMHPFLSLILGSAFVGLAAPVPLPMIVTNFEDGVGSTLKEVGLLIALGAMLGKLLADSGGADRVIDTLLSKASKAMVPWAMALVAIIIGLPMFFEIGLVLLLPVIVLVTQRSELKLMRVAIPALAGLSVLHGLIPPHPGPLIAIAAVHAQLGTTLALGILVAIPTVILCGPLLSILITRVVPVGVPAYAGGVDTTATKSQHEDVKRPPSFGVTLATILFPCRTDVVQGAGRHHLERQAAPSDGPDGAGFHRRTARRVDPCCSAGDGDVRLRASDSTARRSPRGSEPASGRSRR